MQTTAKKKVYPYENYITDDIKSQVSKYQAKKNASFELREYLIASLRVLRQTDKLLNVRNCGSYLIFRQGVTDENTVAKLDKIYLCKHKYCVFCQAIKASKKLKALKEVFAESETDRYKYKFITLTAPSVPAEDLRAQVNAMQSALNALNTSYKKSGLLHGFYKSVELTYNKDTNMFHPHLHIVADCEYIPQQKLCEDWTRLCRFHAVKDGNYDRDFVCDIRLAFKPHELCKYIVKPDTLNADAVFQLVKTNALGGMRDCSSSGTIRDRLKKIENKLKLQTEENKIKVNKTDYNEVVFLWNGLDKYNIKQ